MRAYKQHIISNTAVIGHRKWEEKDGIKRTFFTVKHADCILSHRDKIQSLSKPIKEQEDYDFCLFVEKVTGLTIRIDYRPTYTMGYNDPEEVKSVIQIEYDDETTLAEYLEYVTSVVQFFSLCLNVPMVPSDIGICRLSYDEMLNAIKDGRYPGDYKVKYAWPEAEVNDRDLWAGYSFVRAYNDEELSSLKGCLIAWIERHNEWKKASRQMSTCAKLKNEISADRLLAACKWFEDIPLVKQQEAISSDDIESIAKTAAQKAEELGYQSYIERIIGSLKSIKTEGHKDRASRLLKMVRSKFGEDKSSSTYR